MAKKKTSTGKSKLKSLDAAKGGRSVKGGFLGKLIKKAGGAVGSSTKSPIAK